MALQANIYTKILYWFIKRIRFIGRYCESLELTGDNTILVKNKGGYTAKVLFTYTNSEGTFLDGKSLLNGQQYVKLATFLKIQKNIQTNTNLI